MFHAQFTGRHLFKTSLHVHPVSQDKKKKVEFLNYVHQVLC